MWAGLERCLMHSEVIFFVVRCAGVFCIVGGCTGMSLLVCASMEMRVRYLEELWNHLQRLSGEIRSYIHTPAGGFSCVGGIGRSHIFGFFCGCRAAAQARRGIFGHMGDMCGQAF